MPFRIFLSHTGLDSMIAESVKKNINNAFLGEIEVFLAVHDLLPGMHWKDEVKRRLKTHDAIISIITPRSLFKPWIYIEWTAFWLNDKPSYILISDDVNIADLVSPMIDVQAARMSRADDIRKLFQTLSDETQFQRGVPWDHVDGFVTDFNNAEVIVLEQIARSGYGRYRDNPTDLPTDKEEQRKIAEFFINQGDFETFGKILPRLQGVRVQIAQKLIEMGDIQHAGEVIDSLKASNSFKSVGRTLFDYGHADTPLMKQVIDRTTNHTEKRALGRHIFEHGGEESDVFDYLIHSFTSGAELKNLAIYFLDEDRIASPAFDEIVTHLENLRISAQLKNLAIEFINRDMTDRRQFERLVKALEHYPSRAEELLAFWAQNSRHSAEEGLNSGIITAPSLVEYLKKLLA